MKTKLLLLATLLAGGWTSVAHGQETDAETDYTSWLNNPTCTENDGWAWTRAASNAAAGYIVSNEKLNSSVYTGNGVEYWSSSNSDIKNKDLLWQVVRNLPAGKYKVTAYAAGRNQGATNSTDDDSNNTTLNFFGNGATQQVTSMTWQSYEVEATVGNDGFLKVGLAGGADNQNHWVAIAQVGIAYLNNAESAKLLVAEADSLKNVISGGNSTDLDAAINAANALTEASSATDCKTTIEALQVAMNEYMQNNVSEESALDMTDRALVNAGFDNEAMPTYGWNFVNNFNSGVAFASGVGERWHAVFETNQTIKALPRGKYRLTVQAAYADDANAFQIYARNSVETVTGIIDDPIQRSGSGSDLQQAANFMNENPTEELTSVEVEVYNDGELTVGMACTGTRTWCVWNGFKLEYLGIDITELKAAYQTLKANVETFNSETVASEEAETDMTSALAMTDAAVGEALPVKVLAATNDLWTAVRTYAAAVTDLAEGVEQTDVTFLAQNMDFASNDVAPWTKTVDNSGGNFRMMAPDAANLKYDGRFLESYVNTGKVAANANLKLVYQTLTGMPVGGYTFQARAFNRDAWFNDGRTLNPILLYVNNGETEADSRTLETVFTVNGASGDGVVEFGLKSPADFNSDWNGIADAHLYYTGAAEELALSESDETYEVAGTVANVTLTRNLKAEAWNTFCVPFDMTAEQLAENGITDVRKLETATVEGTSVTLNFSESSLTAVEAGVPYLVKVTDYNDTINVENAVMAAAPGAVTVDGVTMTGNYAAGTVPVGAYFISNNAFYYADEASNVALKGFRAYINVNETFEAIGANRLMININGEVTGIEDVLGEEAAKADKLVNVVSLDGMTVKAGVKKSEALDGLQKGIYIVDGKKYVVK